MNYQDQYKTVKSYLNGRPIDSNHVRESPVPQGYLHHSMIELDRYNGRFQSQAGRPVFASAIAKYHAYSSPQPQIAPFKSPQPQNFSSTTNIHHRHWKNNVPFDDRASFDGNNGGDVSFSRQSLNDSVQSLHQQPSLQNRSLQQFQGSNNRLIDRSLQHRDGNYLGMNQRQIPVDGRDMVYRQSVDLQGKSSAGANNTYEESFHEAFENQDNSMDAEMGPCSSLHMWIIKPVPGTNKICVEGKKSLLDENFWHSGEITRRLSDKLVMSLTGSLYKLEGNMELLDAMAEGFSRKTAESFWLGFPADWERLIDDHFRTAALNNTGEAISEPDEDIMAIDDVGIDIDGANNEASQPARNEDDVDSVDGFTEINISDHGKSALNENDGDEVETVQDKEERKKERSKKSSETKDVVLENWIIKPLPGGKGIIVLGTKADGSLWHTSAIEKRLDKRHVLSLSGATYKLKGPLDKLVALNEDLPMPIIDRFKDGFPKDWLELIQEHFNKNKSQKKKQTKQQKLKNNKHVANKDKENINSIKEKAMKQKSAKTPDMKVLSSKKLNNSNHKTSARKTASSKKLDNSIHKASDRKTPSSKKLDNSTHKASDRKTPSSKKLDNSVHKASDRKTPSSKKLDNSVHKASDRKTPSSKKLDNSNPKKVVKKSTTEKKTLNTSIELHKTSTKVITPRGELVDLETLGQSRSGRLIKPPLQWWTGQTLELEGGSASVKTPTIGASLYVRDFEQQFELTRQKLKPYWNPKEKGRDYSLNTTKSSFISSNVSSDNDTITKRLSEKENLSNSSLDTNLEVEVNVVLKKMLKRKPRSERETCYKKTSVHVDNAIEGTSSCPFDMNDSTDCDDSNKHAGDSTSSKQRTQTVTLKTARARRQQQREINTEQNNTVSSSTGDINVDNVTHADNTNDVSVCTDSGEEFTTSAPARKHRSSKTTSNVFPVKVKRSSRRKHLNVILEDEVLEDTENTEPTSRSSRSERSRKRTLQKENTTTELCDTVDDHWTKEEKDQLAEACKSVSISHPHYWENVAAFVRTKSAELCKDFYYRNEKTPKSAEKKKKNTKGKEKVTAVTANVGTLKRKQQLRDILDQQNENYSDDLFDSTPYKASRKRKMPKLSDVDDDAIFEELAKKQGKSRFETPTASGMGTSRITVPFASSKKTPKSCVNIEEEVPQSNDNDGYVHKMIKRRMLSKSRKKSKETPDAKKKNSGLETSPKQNLHVLFTEYVNEKKNNDENYVNSDEEVDDYWEGEDS